MKSDKHSATFTHKLSKCKWPLFSFGQVTVTAKCYYTLQRHKLSAFNAFGRHTSGDWGDLDPKHKALNDKALLSGKAALSSVYTLAQGVRVRIITAPNRSRTMILLAEGLQT